MGLDRKSARKPILPSPAWDEHSEDGDPGNLVATQLASLVGASHPNCRNHPLNQPQSIVLRLVRHISRFPGSSASLSQTQRRSGLLIHATPRASLTVKGRHRSSRWTALARQPAVESKLAVDTLVALAGRLAAAHLAAAVGHLSVRSAGHPSVAAAPISWPCDGPRHRPRHPPRRFAPLSCLRLALLPFVFLALSFFSFYLAALTAAWFFSAASAAISASIDCTTS